VDSAAGDREGVAKNEAIASRGADQMDRGGHHGANMTTAGTTTAGTQPVHTTSASHTADFGQQTDAQYGAPPGMRR
jgi:hypothetical protein